MVVMKPVYILGAGAVVAALAWIAYRKVQSGESFGYTVGSEIANGAFDMADGVLTGTIEAIGEKVGVPKTNLTECERAKLEGRTWDASFACPATDFVKYLWN
jgi:hypothetical protein